MRWNFFNPIRISSQHAKNYSSVFEYLAKSLFQREFYINRSFAYSTSQVEKELNEELRFLLRKNLTKYSGMHVSPEIIQNIRNDGEKTIVNFCTKKKIIDQELQNKLIFSFYTQFEKYIKRP